MYVKWPTLSKVRVRIKLAQILVFIRRMPNYTCLCVITQTHMHANFFSSQVHITSSCSLRYKERKHLETMSRKVRTLCEVYVVYMLLLPYSDIYGVCSLKCENQKEETLSTVLSYNKMFAYKRRNRRGGQFHKVFLFVFILPVIAFCLKACFN